MAYKFVRHGQPRPCITINPEPPASVMTVPIVGVPRGGTTMVAAVVHALGVDIGPEKDLAAFTFEDQAMNRSAPGVQLSYIKRRNTERAVWGWKDPAALHSIRPLFFSLRKPRLIVVFRDMLASIESEMRFDVANDIMPRRDFAQLAEMTFNWWKGNMEFIEQTTFPTLLVSYENALRMPDIFVHGLSDFLGITPSHEMLQEASARINPHGGYLQIDQQGKPMVRVDPLPADIVAPIVATPEPPPEPPV